MSKRIILATLCLAAVGLAAVGVGAAGADDIFPYPVHQKTLENGLRVIVIPFDSPGVVAYHTIVRTGSREEVEPGHSGFAHFFEHMMFRGTESYPQDAYNDILKRMGADSNAFTSDDRTQYYIVGPASELATMVEIEADRFQNLEYSQEVFRREALAVLGEYNKNASSPFLPMYERMRELAFTEHTYGHTTMGYLEDIRAMPGYYDYSLKFFDRFYRPENCVVLVVGDADPQRVFALAGEHYGGWEPGYRKPEIPTEPPQRARKVGAIDWETPIRPHLMIGYRAPAFSDSSVATAALDVVGQLLFAESAPLYQKLVVEEQWVDSVQGGYSDHRDPYLFTVFARVKSEEEMAKVMGAIREHARALAEEEVSAERLERIKSHLRYSFAQGLDSAASVAFTISGYISLTGDPKSVNRVYEQYRKVTPEDVQRVAREVFAEDRTTVVTLAHTPAAAAEGGEATTAEGE